MASGEFNGKTVIITGAGSGFGARTAQKFAAKGSNLVLIDINPEGLYQTKKACMENQTKDNKVILVNGDISSEKTQKDVFEAALKNFGQIDVLVNNAGILERTPIDNFDMKIFERVQKVNCWSAVSLSILAIPHLKITKGNIVNVSSAGSQKPCLDGLAYCISKSGMDMLTKSLAFELGTEGVRVNAVRPGFVPTNLTKHVSAFKNEQVAKKQLALNAMNRPGTIDEIADIILFLASDKASFITGALLPVDGGMDIGGLGMK